MIKMTLEGKEKWVFTASFILALVASVAVMVYIAAQTFIRWKINQNYTLLGGSELEALTVSTFALIIALVCAYRPGKHDSH